MTLDPAFLLEQILSEKAVRIAFQPIVDLSDGSVFGHEALARGKGALEMPGALFPCARTLGKTWELEKTCRENALAAMGKGNSPLQPCRLFLNASPRVFADPRFPEVLAREIGRIPGISRDQIVVELTEQEGLEDESLLKFQARHLSGHGFSVALDDFGAGNSGLRILMECCPAFLKLDRGIIRGIDRSALRMQLVKSLVTFADAVGTTLIGEGVETWEEVESLAQLGVRYAQGFLLGRPSFERTEPDPAMRKKLASLCGPWRKEHGMELGILLRDLREPCETFSSEGRTCEELDRTFRKNPEIDHLVLVENGRVSGLVTRQHFYFITGGPVGYSLYQKRPAHSVAKKNPLKVQEGISVTTLADLAMKRKPEDLYDPVVVTDTEDRVLGTVTMRKLIMRSKELETERAMDCNPLTGLPGNRAIERWISSALAQPSFTLIYADLDHFKEYNDRYGFLRGDDLIRFTAGLFRDFLPKIGPEACLGHVGGDDFVFISPGRVREEALAALCEAFDQGKERFFDPEDLERGAYHALNRAGELQAIPLVTLSLAVIVESNLPENPHPGVLSSESAALKKAVKKQNGQTRKSGFLVDRRLCPVGGIIFHPPSGFSAWFRQRNPQVEIPLN